MLNVEIVLDILKKENFLSFCNLNKSVNPKGSPLKDQV